MLKRRVGSDPEFSRRSSDNATRVASSRRCDYISYFRDVDSLVRLTRITKPISNDGRRVFCIANRATGAPRYLNQRMENRLGAQHANRLGRSRARKGGRGTGGQLDDQKAARKSPLQFSRSR